jgi:hypothetical protein
VENSRSDFGTSDLPKTCIETMQTLTALLKDWRTDQTNKVLVFTKSVKLIEVLKIQLDKIGGPHSFVPSIHTDCF